MKPREIIDVLVNTGTDDPDPDAVSFVDRRKTLRNEVYEAIKLAQAKMAVHYDARYRAPELSGSVYLKLAKTGNAGYHLPKTSSLSTKRAGPLKIMSRDLITWY